MPRPRICRNIEKNPNTTYFKPAGVPLSSIEESTLTIDEYEALRLKDFEGLEQEECANKMGISQPTFHRLVICARKKVADSIVNGKAIRIMGGHISFSENRRRGNGKRKRWRENKN